MSSSNPCKGKTFTEDATVNTFLSVDDVSADGGVSGLCVRVEDDDTTTSFAFGVAMPEPHVRDTDGETDDIDAARNRYLTTRLNWTGINVVEDFDFVISLVADPGRKDDINTDSDPDDVQAACEDGRFLAQRTATRTIPISHPVTTELVPYTGYLLCVRHLNGAGKTNWIVPGGENPVENHTLPAAPPAPAPDPSRTGAAGDDGEMFNVAWTVDLEDLTNVPWPKAEFMVSRTLLQMGTGTPKPEACSEEYARCRRHRNSGRNRIRRCVPASAGALGQPIRLCLYPSPGRGRRYEAGALEDRRPSHRDEEGRHLERSTGKTGRPP